MKAALKRPCMRSFLFTSIYFGTSWLCFYTAAIEFLEDTEFESILMILDMPAAMVWGMGFSQGIEAAFLAGIVIFIAIWAISFALFWAYAQIRRG